MGSWMDDDDEGADASRNTAREWDFEPSSGEGSAAALRRMKRLERARAVLRGRQNKDRDTPDREGPSQS